MHCNLSIFIAEGREFYRLSSKRSLLTSISAGQTCPAHRTPSSWALCNFHVPGVFRNVTFFMSKYTK